MDAIRGYLGRLAALAFGMDAAVVHDMLADAEDHLRNAVRDGMTPEAAMEAFGRPEDVVWAYLNEEKSRKSDKVIHMEKLSGPQFSRSAGAADQLPPAQKDWLAAIPVVGIWFDLYAWGSLAFFILGLIPALVYFVVLVTGISLGLGLSVTLVGLPLLVLMLGMARAMALFHGQMIEKMTGVRMPRRYAAPPAQPGNGFWRRIKLWLTDGRSWLSAAFLVGNLPVAVFLFSLFVSLASLGLGFLAMPVTGVLGRTWLQLDPKMELHLVFWDVVPDANGHVHLTDSAMVFGLVAGLVVATLTLYLARGAGWLYAQAAKAIQVTRPQMAM